MHHLANRLATLAIISVIIILLAWLTFNYQSNQFAQGDETQLFLPELADNIENISTIEITQRDDSLVVEKKASQWILAEQGDYQVDSRNVRKLVQSLANASVIEAKTSDPKRFSLLGLDAPSNENTTARVVIFDINGNAMADVLIGSLRRAQGNARYSDAFYIRRTNEDQAWLVNGSVEASPRINDWMNRELLRLNNKHIASVNIDHPRSKSKDVNIKRTSQPEEGEATFIISNLPKGKQVTSALDVEAIVNVVKDLNFINAANKDTKSFKQAKAVKATYSLDGGLDITLSVWHEKESDEAGAAMNYWMAVSYKVTSDDTPEAITSVTKRLDNYKNWFYQIGGYQGKLLTKTLDQLSK